MSNDPKPKQNIGVVVPNFLTSLDRMNLGGAGALANANQKIMIAALNQKAGKRSLERSDLNTAQKFFEHGEI